MLVALNGVREMFNFFALGQNRPAPLGDCSTIERDPFFSDDNNGPFAVPSSSVALYVQLMAPHFTLTSPSPATSAVSCPNFANSTVVSSLTSATVQLPQFVYVKLPLASSGSPNADRTSAKNKTSHSTVMELVTSVAFAPDNVASCRCETTLPSGHAASPGSFEHRAVDSAIADPAPTNAIAISAASAARPSIFRGLIFSPFPAFRRDRSWYAPGISRALSLIRRGRRGGNSPTRTYEVVVCVGLG